MRPDDPINILHRYFIWANRMRVHFDDILGKHMNNEIDEHGIEIEWMIYMSVWYGLLYVVVEGWKDLKLKDDAIDMLLKSKNTDLLRHYRNATFHYPRKHEYNDKRFENFYKETSTVEWIRKLNSELGRFFLEYHKNNN